MILLSEIRGKKHSKEIDEALEQLCKEKEIIMRVIDGEERFCITAGSFCEDLRDYELDENCGREIVYELESLGLIRLRRKEDDWFWCLTRKGEKSVLASYDKALTDAFSELGLDNVLERKDQMQTLRDETGLFEKRSS